MINQFKKSSWENWDLDVNFASRKPASATAIASVALLAYRRRWPGKSRTADNSVLGSTVGSVVNSTKARLTVTGGTSGNAYDILVRATWNSGHRTEHALVMRVEDN